MKKELEKIKIELKKKITTDETYNLVMKLYIANKEDFSKLEKNFNEKIKKIDKKIDKILQIIEK